MRLKPYWLAYLIGGHYRGGWRPSLYRHLRRYYRERWGRAGYTLTDWLLNREKTYFRRAEGDNGMTDQPEDKRAT